MNSLSSSAAEHLGGDHHGIGSYISALGLIVLFVGIAHACGMNLVAKEYVACQDPENPGVLILSRFAGAAVECNAALLVNPYDPESVGTTIGQALSMPLDERRSRHDALFQVLMANDVKVWGERFLIALTRPLNFPNWVGQMSPALIY